VCAPAHNAIYNPDIDTDGSDGRGLAAAIRSALAG
jgi:hypothetical protein